MACAVCRVERAWDDHAPTEEEEGNAEGDDSDRETEDLVRGMIRIAYAEHSMFLT